MYSIELCCRNGTRCSQYLASTKGSIASWSSFFEYVEPLDNRQFNGILLFVLRAFELHYLEFGIIAKYTDCAFGCILSNLCIFHTAVIKSWLLMHAVVALSWNYAVCTITR